MNEHSAPYHAHIYATAETRAQAVTLEWRLAAAKASGAIAELFYIGELRDRDFSKGMLPLITPLLEASGLTSLVHPLTDNDLADHTTLATWIGEPLPLKLDVLDPPGKNPGVARFGKSDF